MLQVRLPGSATFAYALPSLHEPELAWIRSVEQRLHCASYDMRRCVPVFWDTEATGLGSVLWWAPRRHRVVQIAAALDAGSRDFKVDINPYPVAMSDGAAETTGLTTPTVWANTVPPQVRIAWNPSQCMRSMHVYGSVGWLAWAVCARLQVGLARFLEFCLDTSEAHGGAVPVLVAHNSNFDNGMLLGDCWQSGLHVPPQWRSLCTYRMAKRIAQVACPELTSLPNMSLGTLARHFGCARTASLHACGCSCGAAGRHARVCAQVDGRLCGPARRAGRRAPAADHRGRPPACCRGRLVR